MPLNNVDDRIICRQQNCAGRFCTCKVQCIRRLNSQIHKFMIAPGGRVLHPYQETVMRPAQFGTHCVPFFWQSEYRCDGNNQEMPKRTSESFSDSLKKNLFQTHRSSGRSDHFRRNIRAVPDPLTIYASFLSNMHYIHVTGLFMDGVLKRNRSLFRTPFISKNILIDKIFEIPPSRRC